MIDQTQISKLSVTSIQLGPYILGHLHNFHHFGSVHHHNGLEIKQSWCTLSTDFKFSFNNNNLDLYSAFQETQGCFT